MPSYRYQVRTTAGELQVGTLASDNVATAAAVLRNQGYRVLSAYGGAEAIRVAGSEAPDLVILDLMMPGVSGFEVARALRALEPTARIPILVLTAKDLSAEDQARQGMKRANNGQDSDGGR